MNFLQRAAARLTGAKKQQSITNPYNEAFLWGAGGGQTNYDPLNTTFLESGYNINPFVYFKDI